MTSALPLEVCPDASSAALRVAGLIADRARKAVEQRGRFTLAVSGGRTPWAMLRALRDEDVPWHQTTLYQVDERVAAAGHPDRNLAHILGALAPGAARDSVRPMPVEETDLEAAAERYAAALPDRFDLVHLGLGADGHTASLVPGDAVLDIRDRAVALTDEYQETRRMTLTFPALDKAGEIVWLVTGEDKRDALARLLARDESIPAVRVSNPRQLVVADESAARSHSS